MEWPGPDGSLRDLINRRAEAIEKQLGIIGGLIQAMNEKPVRHYEFENLKLQVASLAEGLTELEQRVGELEQHKSLASWLFRQVVTVVVIVVLIYILENWR